MIPFISVLTALLILLGILALPYSLLVTGACWLVGGLLIAAVYVRQRPRLRLLLASTLIVSVVGALIWQFVLMPWVNQEWVTGVTTLNPDGAAGRALVVYHPGRSDLQARAASGFAEGLTAKGWRVDMTTASDQAAANISDYDLLVVGAQSYTWAPARPVQAYLRRVGALGGLPVVAILSGLGETGPATAVMRNLIAEVNGTLIEVYHVWQWRPIDDLYGTDDVAAAMRGAAASLQLRP